MCITNQKSTTLFITLKLYYISGLTNRNGSYANFSDNKTKKEKKNLQIKS